MSGSHLYFIINSLINILLEIYHGAGLNLMGITIALNKKDLKLRNEVFCYDTLFFHEFIVQSHLPLIPPRWSSCNICDCCA